MSILKKELIIFIGLFLFLAIGMHFKEWKSHPMEHFVALGEAEAFGVGASHPIIFTLILYVVVLVVRLAIRKASSKD